MNFISLYRFLFFYFLWKVPSHAALISGNSKLSKAQKRNEAWTERERESGIEKYDDDAGFESHSYMMMNLLSTKRVVKNFICVIFRKLKWKFMWERVGRLVVWVEHVC